MKPIGYWLNRTDQALTASMNAMLDAYGLTRLAWQVLNAVKDSPQATDTDILTTLAAHADDAHVTAAIDTLLTDGWATRPSPTRLTLTDDGRARLTEVAERVAAFRDLSTTGISHEEYRNAVTVLERITHNLETAPKAQPSSP